MFQIEKPSVCLNPCYNGHRKALSEKEHTLGDLLNGILQWVFHSLNPCFNGHRVALSKKEHTLGVVARMFL